VRDQNLRNWFRVVPEPLGKANPELFTVSHLTPIARLFLEVKKQTILVEENFGEWNVGKYQVQPLIRILMKWIKLVQISCNLANEKLEI